MLPAGQRLEAFHLAGRDVDDRHVVEQQLVAQERAAQVGLHLQMAGRRRLAGLALEDGGARLAQRLGAVHRHVRVAQHVLGLLVIGGPDRGADAGAGADFLAAELERLAHYFVHAVGDADGVGGSAHVVEPHGELVAAVARQRVAFAQARFQPPRDLLQQLIAGLVAEGVVDGLEAVDVDEEDRESIILVTARSIKGMAKQIEEQRAIRQPGERVVARVVRHPLDDEAVPGDVAHQAGHADGGAGSVAPGRAAHREPAPVAVGMADPVLVLQRCSASLEVRGQRSAQRRGVFRMHAIEPVRGRAGKRRGKAEDLAPA